MQVTEGSRTGVEEDSVERDLNSGPCPVPLTRPTDCLYDCLPRCHVVFFCTPSDVTSASILFSHMFRLEHFPLELR